PRPPRGRAAAPARRARPSRPAARPTRLRRLPAAARPPSRTARPPRSRRRPAPSPPTPYSSAPLRRATVREARECRRRSVSSVLIRTGFPGGVPGTGEARRASPPSPALRPPPYQRLLDGGPSLLPRRRGGAVPQAGGAPRVALWCGGAGLNEVGYPGLSPSRAIRTRTVALARRAR